ncbi:MAG TPA: hypothetical protein VN868_06380 [Terriglobales bacterium]|nr:hypothetical protein [Terriglobales bacterium]
MSISNTGGGSLTFTGASDQPWLMFSPSSGTVPSALQVSPSVAGLKAATSTGHFTVNGGGATKTVTVSLTLTSAAAQHSVALSWTASSASNPVSYKMYRSTATGASDGLLASAVSGTAYTNRTVQPGTVYYYAVTTVNSAGQESAFSNHIRVTVP